MIKKVQRRLILLVFLSVTGVLLILIAVIYGSLGIYSRYQADGMTELIRHNNGDMPHFQQYKDTDIGREFPFRIIFNEESEYRTRYFIVYFDETLSPTDVDINHIAAVTRLTALAMAAEAFDSGHTTGYIDTYRFRISKSETANMLIFLDCSESFTLTGVVLKIVCFTAVLIVILVTSVYAIFSKHVVRPFEENMLRQKQFITDASHELKTPLSIICANAEVLQYKEGESEWTKNIVTQTARLNGLIGSLLKLAKMDEMDENIALESFNFSTLAEETILTFQEIAKQKHVSVQSDIHPDIMLIGCPEQLKLLVSSLTENAVKYVNSSGTIEISLKTSGKNAVFKIFNTTEQKENIDLNRLFDRFYRPDHSRSSATGGYGIGLSIAKKTAVVHGGSLNVSQSKSGICFTAVIPLQNKSGNFVRAVLPHKSTSRRSALWHDR